MASSVTIVQPTTGSSLPKAGVLSPLRSPKRFQSLMTAGLAALSVASGLNLRAAEVVLVDQTQGLAQATTPDSNMPGTFLVSSSNSRPSTTPRLSTVGTLVVNDSDQQVTVNTVTANVVGSYGRSSRTQRTSEIFKDAQVTVAFIADTPEGHTSWSNMNAQGAGVQTAEFGPGLSFNSAQPGQASYAHSGVYIDADRVEQSFGITKIEPWTITFNLSDDQHITIPAHSRGYLTIRFKLKNDPTGAGSTMCLLDNPTSGTNNWGFYRTTEIGAPPTAFIGDPIVAQNHNALSVKVVGAVSGGVTVPVVDKTSIVQKPEGLCLKFEGEAISAETIKARYALMFATNATSVNQAVSWAAVALNTTAPGVVVATAVNPGEAGLHGDLGFFRLVELAPAGPSWNPVRLQERIPLPAEESLAGSRSAGALETVEGAASRGR